MLNQLTNTLTGLITNLYVSTGLVGILLAMAIESCCIPLPSEIVMPLAGIMIANGKILHGTNPVVALILVALAGAAGCLVGSIAAYGIGYAGGRPLMLKYGKYVLISQHDADRADAFFVRWGSATAFFSRLLPVVRTYISLPAGIARMPFVKFCIYTFLGSFPWCVLLAYVGMLLGNNLDRLGPIFHNLDIVILVLIVLLVVLYVWRHIRNDRKARAEHALADAEAAAITTSEQQSGANQYGQPGQPGQFGQSAQTGQPQQFQQPQGAQYQQPQQWGQPPQPYQQQPQQWDQQSQQAMQQRWNAQSYPQQGQPQRPPQHWQPGSGNGQQGQPGQPNQQNQPGQSEPQQPRQLDWPEDDRTVRRS